MKSFPTYLRHCLVGFTIMLLWIGILYASITLDWGLLLDRFAPVMMLSAFTAVFIKYWQGGDEWRTIEPKEKPIAGREALHYGNYPDISAKDRFDLEAAFYAMCRHQGNADAARQMLKQLNLRGFGLVGLNQEERHTVNAWLSTNDLFGQHAAYVQAKGEAEFSSAGPFVRKQEEGGPRECPANGTQGCWYGPHGPKGEEQCQWCGSERPPTL